MPGLPFQNLPAAQVKEITGRLRSQWQIEARALSVRPFKSQEQADAELAKLNAKYQRLEFDSLSELQQQQRVQQLISQPRERTREEEAGLRMELRPEAERLVFPPEPTQQQPFSISQLGSKAMIESIDYFAESAPDTPGWEWGPPKKTKQGLVNQYLQWRELAQYDALNPRRQQQLDQRWDISMAEDKRFDEWWLDKEKRKPIVEIRALRTPGDMGKIMRGRITGAEGITPLGRSVIKEKPRSAISKAALPMSGKEAREAYGFPGGPPPPGRTQPQAGQAPIRQRNRRTGQERISYDGGKTWQMIG